MSPCAREICAGGKEHTPIAGQILMQIYTSPGLQIPRAICHRERCRNEPNFLILKQKAHSAALSPVSRTGFWLHLCLMIGSSALHTEYSTSLRLVTCVSGRPGIGQPCACVSLWVPGPCSGANPGQHLFAPASGSSAGLCVSRPGKRALWLCPFGTAK